VSIPVSAARTRGPFAGTRAAAALPFRKLRVNHPNDPARPQNYAAVSAMIL
jgi:hypothetical protein